MQASSFLIIIKRRSGERRGVKIISTPTTENSTTTTTQQIKFLLTKNRFMNRRAKRGNTPLLTRRRMQRKMQAEGLLNVDEVLFFILA